MKKNILLFFMLSISVMCSAQFSGRGSGTEKDPYLVSNADELYDVRNELNAYYKQIEDIDLSEWIEENNPNQGWSPIGTKTNPFYGHFDGNNKIIKGLYINRPSLGDVGLFGSTLGVDILNVSILNPQIIGGDNVGAIVGKIWMANAESDISILNNVVVGGNIEGSHYVGGVVGNVDTETNIPTRTAITIKIQGNYCSMSLVGDIVGGICGTVRGAICGYYCDRPAFVTDNLAENSIVANIGGGIVGIISDNYISSTSNGTRTAWHSESIKRNISKGHLNCRYNAGGVIGTLYMQNKNDQIVENNFSCLEIIKSLSSPAYRVTNYEFNEQENSALSSTVVISNGKEINVEDDGFNGTGYGLKTLMRKSTYSSQGFDFNEQWDIIEGESYPYNYSQSTPPIVESFYSGSKSCISGVSNEYGKIYVFVNNTLFESQIIDGKWNVNLGNIQDGTTAKVCSVCNDLKPSILKEATAVNAPIIDPEKISGDSNADGVVDAADVVGTINYILGKPSSSFNQQNADVNEDGQILVDDAVGTVNVIMNNQ